MKSKRKKLSIVEMAEKSLREVVKEAIKEHKLRGVPIAVWRNGKAVLIKPEHIKIDG